MINPFQVGVRGYGYDERGLNEIAEDSFVLSQDRFIAIRCDSWTLTQDVRGVVDILEYNRRGFENRLYIPLDCVLALRDCQKSKVVEEYPDYEYESNQPW